EVYALTDKGREYLLSASDPRQLLEDLVRALEGREAQLGELLDRVRAWQSGLADLRGQVERLLPAADPEPTADDAVLRGLAAWHAAGAAEDCPLPELYRRARAE